MRTRIRWTHPELGGISEAVCSKHEEEVLNAASTLGIEVTGQFEYEDTPCIRCAAKTPARTWLPTVAERP